LKAYVQRAFDKCLNSVEEKLMEGNLRTVIETAKKTKEVFSRNWNTYQLPKLPREKNISYGVGTG